MGIKVLDGVIAAGVLRDALYRASDRTEDAGRRQVLLGRHLLLEDAAQEFAAAPADGAESPSYDPAAQRGRDAAPTIDTLNPSRDPDLRRIGREAGAGIEALQRITRAVAIAASGTARDGAGSRWRVRGALRLGVPPPGEAGTGTIAAAADPASPKNNGGPVLASLTKLFPAEAVSVYTLGAALLHGEDPPLWWFPLLVAAGLVLFRSLATQPVGGGKPQVAAIAAAAVSFLLWVAMLGDPFWPSGSIDDRTRAIAGAGAVEDVWVWLAPLIVERIDGPDAGEGDAGDQARVARGPLARAVGVRDRQALVVPMHPTRRVQPNRAGDPGRASRGRRGPASAGQVGVAAASGALSPLARDFAASFGGARIAAADGPSVLVLSGGGQWGAFGAGYLRRWSKGPIGGESRPAAFDIVTGVSTGSLQATYAFLGAGQDDALVGA